ncbi:hypothetical protein ABK040_003188 [Willaertia magna]
MYFLLFGGAVILTTILAFIFKRKKEPYPIEGKNVLIVGGSTGIGYGIAMECVKQNISSLTLIARREDKLIEAKTNLSKLNPNVTINYISCDVANKEQLKEMVTTKLYNKEDSKYDLIYINQGISIPGYILEQEFESFKYQMKLNYFSHVLLSKLMLPYLLKNEETESHIFFVGSVCSITSFVGYGSYSPTKYAIKAYAEALRNELVGTNVKIHLVLPVDTKTEGYDKENLTKPKECMKLSNLGGEQTLEESGKAIVNEFCRDKHQFYISCNLDTYLQLCGSLGAGPNVGSSLILDGLVNLIMYPVLRYYSSYFDKESLLAHKERRGVLYKSIVEKEI